MSDEWMPRLTLPLSADEFRRLPRHPAYRYEYYDGAGQLSPWPRSLHARLGLARFLAVPREAPDDVVLRPVRGDDWAAMPAVFAAAFANLQPFGSLDDAQRERTARTCLERTRTGGDGPWLARASYAA